MNAITPIVSRPTPLASPQSISEIDAYLRDTLRDRFESMPRRQVAGCVLASSVGAAEQDAQCIKKIGIEALSGVLSPSVAVALATVGRQLIDAVQNTKTRALCADIFVGQILAHEDPGGIPAVLCTLAANGLGHKYAYDLTADLTSKAFERIAAASPAPLSEEIAAFASDGLPHSAYGPYHIELRSHALAALAAVKDDPYTAAVAQLAQEAAECCKYPTAKLGVQEKGIVLAASRTRGEVTLPRTLARYGLDASTLGPVTDFERLGQVFYDEDRRREAKCIRGATLRAILHHGPTPGEKLVALAALRFDRVFADDDVPMKIYEGALRMIADGETQAEPAALLDQFALRAAGAAGHGVRDYVLGRLSEIKTT